MNKVIFLLPFLILLYGEFLYSQEAPEVEWAKSYGGDTTDQAYSIQQTFDGGFIVLGTTLSNNGDVSGNHLTYNGTTRDYWIVKLSSTGSILWQKCLGGSFWDVGTDVKQTSDGGFVLVGGTSSNDGDVTGLHDAFDFWIVKLDSIGNLIWQKCFGGEWMEFAASVQQTIDGGYIVAGTAGSDYGDVIGNHGLDDYWIMRLDSLGNLIWKKCLGGTGNDRASCVKQTNDGGFIIAGTTDSNNYNVTGNHGENDIWIVKLSSAGSILWQKCYGGSGNESASSIIETFDGEFVVAGTAFSNDGDVICSYGETCWIIKLDTVGNLLWQKCLGNNAVNIPGSVVQDNDGNFIVASMSTDFSCSHGGFDYWLSKLDSLGNFKWQKCLGGTKDDRANSAIQTIDGGFVLVGYSNSDDEDVIGNHGDYDYWIVKLSSEPISGLSLPPINFVSLSPNPAQSQLHINLSTYASGFIFLVYDLTGRLFALPIAFQNTIAQFSIQGLPSGFYTVQIISKKTGVSEVAKFIKE